MASSYDRRARSGQTGPRTRQNPGAARGRSPQAARPAPSGSRTYVRGSGPDARSSTYARTARRAPQGRKPAPTRYRQTGVRKRPTLWAKGGGQLSKPFVANLVILIIFGLIILFSASYATGYYYDGDSFEYVFPQAIYSIFGLGVMYVASRMDYHFLRRWTYLVYILTLVMLVAVLIPGVGVTLNGCTRWIKIRGIPMPSIQPSEIAKFAVILLTAHLLTSHSKRLKNVFYVIGLPVLLLAPIELLLNEEPHHSAMILMVGIMFVMLWAGGVALRWFVSGAVCAAVGMTVFIISKPGYVAERLSGWRDPFGDPLDTTMQISQSLYAIGNGGLFGVGIGNSSQKQLWLPEANNDFIFSILCEELGFVGAVVCIGLFAAFILQGVYIAVQAPDRYGCLLGVGVMAQISIQVLMNIAVVTNTIPNTGISLPFFSSGGTSMVMLLGEVGVLLSVNRASSAMAEKKRAEENKKRAEEGLKQQRDPEEGA